jgi:hypothetical protein
MRPTVIIVAGAVVGLFFLYLKPTYALITEMRAEEQRILETVEQFREASREMERLKTSYQSISAQDLDKMDKFLPKGFDPAEFVLYIHRIASNYGLIITDLEVIKDNNNQASADQATKALFETTTFTFTVDAPYAVFIAMMQDLEKSLRPLDIAQMTFSASDQDRYPFNVTLQTYWLKQ